MTDLRDVLNDKGIKYKNTNNPLEILVQCTSGDHTDQNPSLAFNLDKNVFNCFSCGFSGGIGKFLESIGITQKLNIESKQEYRILKLKKKLLSIKNIDSIKMPHAYTDVTWDFLGITKKTWMSFKAFTTSEYELEDYLCVPIYQFKRLKFIEARKKVSNINIPKYLRKPTFSTVSEVAFPIDKIDNTNHVVLVEGLTDMLNLWQNGRRDVLCIFGANNFNYRKIELLEKIGITKVTLMLDGDQAGRTASKRIQNLLEKHDVLTKRINLKEGEDPGTLTYDQIQYYL